MSPGDGTDAPLRQELEALGEQVKLLTRTEQRLHRSQAALDQQLARIEALAEFSFRAARAEDNLDVVFRALEIVADTYDVDGGVVVTTARSGVEEMKGLWEVPSGLGAEDVLGLAELVQVVRVIEWDGSDAQAVAARRALAGTDVSAMVVMALRDAEGRLLAALAAWKTGERPSNYREDLLRAHDAYLFALASHAARGIERVTLTTQLRAQADELTTANARLQASLDHLESTQAALLESQKLEAVARLAGGVAHDFNNLMTVVLGHVDFIREGLPDAPSPGTLAEIRAAVTKASELTMQLLAFGRKQPREAVPTELSTAVPKTMRAVRPALRDDIVVSVESSPSLPDVTIDRQQLDQILLNLVLNARDAMPHGGTLRVRARRPTPSDLELVGASARGGQAGFVVLEVSDTGEGMAPEVVERVFEPFFTTKELGRGSGLGLASVYGLVRQNHGLIGVASDVGVGTSFRVLLPTADSGVWDAAPPDEEAPLILVAEDNDGIRGLCVKILQKEGYRVAWAQDGIEALAALEAAAGSVALILTDVIMPRMGGADLVRRARELRADLPVIYMSGHPFDDLDRGTELAGDGYLAKPFSPTDLRSAVRSALPNRSAPPNRSGLRTGVEAGREAT